ncbi:MAG: HAMP domain-containing histidine kinase [Gemmatimonadetes bacterium]|nr:HAMP domain-containing histidine kinase [Gemmatimonadota bacterium]
MSEANPGASPVSRAHRRSPSLETRLFAWLLGVALVPTLLLLAAGTWLGAGSIAWLTGVGPWDRVARSGRALVEAAARDSAADPVLATAARRHRDQLAESLVLARRWSFVGQRLSRLLPLAALGLAALLAGLALAVSRRLARDLARPIAELVEWTERIGREEPLPPPSPAEEREVREVRRLRAAARRAAAELGEARRRALEAERVRIWGEMARRVAHEMKNPLTPLRLAAHRLQAEGGVANEEPLAVIHEETARLEELARAFAALGRPPDGPTSPVDLPELLGSLLATDVPPTIEARLEVTGSVPLVEAHYEALVRAFRNLIRNAVDAVDVTAPPRRITVGVSADGDGVRVRIEDTGPGLPDGSGERIFEPEFTTKARGTGLGLAIVRQAVVAHGGQVRAWTRAEGGATFEVCLPPAPATPMEARA